MVALEEVVSESTQRERLVSQLKTREKLIREKERLLRKAKAEAAQRVEVRLLDFFVTWRI